MLISSWSLSCATACQTTLRADNPSPVLVASPQRSEASLAPGGLPMSSIAGRADSSRGALTGTSDVVDAATSPDSTTTGAAGIGQESASPASKGSAWLGFEARPAGSSLIVERVYRRGPAAAAGLLPGDVLTSLLGRHIGQPSELRAVERDAHQGESLPLVVQRRGARRLLKLTATRKPEAKQLLRDHYVGYPAPPLHGARTIIGSDVPSWAALAGKVVVLDFSASWCAACRALAPTLNDWATQHAAYGVRVVGVTMDPYEDALAYARALDLQYTLCADDGTVTSAYSAFALPTLFVVGRDGIVAEVMLGYDVDELERLDQLVATL